MRARTARADRPAQTAPRDRPLATATAPPPVATATTAGHRPRHQPATAPNFSTARPYQRVNSPSRAPASSRRAVTPRGGRMRVARVGSIRLALAVGVAMALAAGGAASAPGAAPTTTTTPSFKVSISPKYTTASQPTTFRIAVVNTSPQGTTLGSVKISPPKGFTPPHPTLGSPLRHKTKVQNR